MTIYRATRAGLTQTLIRGDLLDQETRDAYRVVLPGQVRAVYSDPPWNPGNSTYWRTHAGLEPRSTYGAFLDAWVDVAAECQDRGAGDVLVEQSANVAHQDLLRAAVQRQPRWTLPERVVYPVRYGSGSRLLPNALIHFGSAGLLPTPYLDPSGMHGEAMTFRVFAGLHLAPGSVVVDPCTGKGMTSRAAHIFGLHFVGSELNPARLDVTLKWLRGQGYAVVEFKS